MRVTNEVIQNAVLQIFMDQKIPEGGCLRPHQLRGHWPHTRLRQGDLVQGLKQLVFNGYLELDDDYQGGMFILTAVGYQRALKLPSGPRGTWNQFVASALLNVARRRPTAEHNDGRRATDVVAAS
ncbi:MAG TPA: hypothetical protein VHE37_06590 [Nevskiaceae bacterium]|nr:hypothetical protein [Nevskiaceae bacterium]